MIKKIKVLYYVDINDNTKGCLCAVPSDKDMRSQSVMKKIKEELECANFGSHGVCSHITQSIVYTHSASLTCQMGNYEFGIEEVPVIE